MPSEVFGSPSSKPTLLWMKKPLVLTPVTTPIVVRNVPFNGEVSPDPWMS
jgi:hypothetical protein